MKLGSVLVVDDDDEIRSTLGAVLQAEGFEVREACNGLHALQQLEQAVPDLILLDLTMPVMTGFEFLDRKLDDARIRDVPVVAITVHAGANDLQGVHRLVPKPFDLEELLATLRDVLAARRAS